MVLELPAPALGLLFEQMVVSTSKTSFVLDVNYSQTDSIAQPVATKFAVRNSWFLF